MTADSFNPQLPTKVMNLKGEEEKTVLLKEIVPTMDILIESFRPGVMERLGLGPNEVHSVNPKLVYVRLTGFGQQPSEYRDAASHDSNYLAVAGLLGKFRPEDINLDGSKSNVKGIPTMPGNIIADYASGSLGSFLLTMQALMT